MILQFDLGNSRFKWRYLDSDSAALQSGVSMLGDLQNGLPEVLRSFVNVDEIHLASVAHEQHLSRLLSLLKEHYPAGRIYVAQAGALIGEVVFSYKCPAHQGVDRCLAMVAGHSLLKNYPDFDGVAVIDAGSALTADFVSRDGRQVAGYICTGLNMMRQALLGSTSKIADGYKSGLTGQFQELTTEVCVERGVLRSFAATVRSLYEEARNKNFLCVVTGGDAPLIEGLLAEEGVVVERDLVLDGLLLAADTVGRNK